MPQRLPEKISPCPINEALLELRYETNTPGDAVFGVVYNEFKHDFPDLVKQPVLQIPEQMRVNDPNLMFLPEYHLSSDQFRLLVGQRVFSVAITGAYCGWEAFSERLENILGRIERIGFIDKISRVGLRYINTFDSNILEKSTLSLSLNGAPLETSSSRIVAQITAGNFEHLLTVANGVTVRSHSSIIGESIIDIDTSTISDLSDFFKNRTAIIEEAHEKEKKLFFDLLSDEYLKTLNPEYS